MSKRSPQRRPPIPQGRAAALPKAGEVTRDDPASPPLKSVVEKAPSQLDARPPMDDNSAPSQLDFDLMGWRVFNLEEIVRRLLLTLPVSAQAEFGALLPEPVAADAPSEA